MATLLHWFRILNPLWFLLFALVRGIHEGMIMTRIGGHYNVKRESGVRGHRWKPVYHAIGGAPYLFLALALLSIQPRQLSAAYAVFLSFAIWENTETGFNVSRYGRPAIEYEHINFFDLYSRVVVGRGVYALHVGRIALGSMYYFLSLI